MTQGIQRDFSWLVVASLTVLMVAGCSDDVAGGEEDCASDEQWNPAAEACEPARTGNDGMPDTGDPSDEDTGEDPGNGDEDAGDNGDNGEDPDTGGPPQPEPCEPADGVGMIEGTVTIPSGELPLPDVSVYVPDGPLDELDPVDPGASCVPCEEELSGDPLDDTTTDVEGIFVLDEVPVGEDIPLVVETGKWRRTTTVDEVEACETTYVDDDDTRLPSNRDEGEMPQFAVTTGECDAVECLIRKIGIDDEEITPDDEDGAVHLFTGRTSDDDEAEGPTYRFADDFNDGEEFTMAEDWWDDSDELLDYDIMLNSCECSPISKDDDAMHAFEEFTDAGGRAFLTHYHYTWLSDTPSSGSWDMEDVADWNFIPGNPGGMDQTATGEINVDFPKGLMLRDWMYETGTTPLGEFDIHHVRGSVDDVDEDIAQDWVTVEGDGDFIGDGGEYIQYFSFNTPVYAQEEDQCGRVVFSDIHVSGREMDMSFDPDPNQDMSGPDYPYPDGCVTDDLSDQEKALVFMLFDLSACILPDDVKKGDW